MTANARLRRVALSLALLAVAVPLAARALAGPPGAIIHVRWRPALTESARTDLEARFHLLDGEPIDAQTRRYDLVDPSTDNIRALVAEAAVADTQHIDRPNRTLDPAAARTARRLRFSARGDRLVAAADGLALAAGVAAFLAIAGTARRRAARRAIGPQSGTALQPHLGDAGDLAMDVAGRPAFWTSMVLAASAPFVIGLCITLWKTPFPITEAVALFEDVASRPVSSFFRPNTAYYRPLFYVALSTFWHNAGSLSAALASIKMLTIVPLCTLVVVFVAYLRPRTALDAAAAFVAVSVLLGSPGLRDNLEIPLSYTIVGMALAVVAWIVLEHERRKWQTPVVIALTLAAIGFKEHGLVLVPLVVGAWWTGAPGARRSSAILLTIVATAYVAFRLSGSASWEPFQQDLGLGFGEVDKQTAAARFGAFPYWIYAYNAGSTMGNILFAEPSRGTFRIVQAAVDGELRPWQVVYVGSSVATTCGILWWGICALRSTREHGWSTESRLFVALVLAVASCGALSFNYSRDRLGGMAVVFYAMAAYCAVRATSVRLLAASRLRVVVAGVALTLVATGWQVRTLATLEQTHVHSWGNQEEWFVRLPDRRLEFANRPVYTQILESMVEQGRNPTAPGPTRLPDWVFLTIGRQ